MFPMWMSLSLYGASTGHVSVEPPSVLEGGGAILEPVVPGGWFVGAHTNKSWSSCLDMSSHVLLWPRWSLVFAILCRHFPRQEALLWAILVRERMVYPSKWVAWMYDIPMYLPSQMARSFIGIYNGGWVSGSYIAWIELWRLLQLGSGSSSRLISETHQPVSLNNCRMHCLTIIPLTGVMAFNHIQMSTLDVSSELL